MTIKLTTNINKALEKIGNHYYNELNISEKIEHSKKIENYIEAKWQIIELINQTYSKVLKNKFDLYNWLYYKEDEVAYFLNEAGSNALNYSEFKMPSKFHLWLGSKGFLIGIEQEGNGFNAVKIDKERIKENEGAAFEFYRNCKSIVFFDNPEDAKVVYLVYLL